MSGSNVADIPSPATPTAPEIMEPSSRVNDVPVTVVGSTGSLNVATTSTPTGTANAPWEGVSDVSSGGVMSTPHSMGMVTSTIHGPPTSAVKVKLARNWCPPGVSDEMRRSQSRSFSAVSPGAMVG